MKEINGFQDFVDDLRIAGFTIGGENGEGIRRTMIRIHGNGGYGSWMSIVILPMESSFLRKAVI